MSDLVSFYSVITLVLRHKHHNHKYDVEFRKLLSYRYGDICNVELIDLAVQSTIDVSFACA